MAFYTIKWDGDFNAKGDWIIVFFLICVISVSRFHSIKLWLKITRTPKLDKFELCKICDFWHLILQCPHSKNCHKSYQNQSNWHNEFPKIEFLSDLKLSVIKLIRKVGTCNHQNGAELVFINDLEVNCGLV